MLTIRLEAGLSEDLKWEQAQALAIEAKNRNEPIFWEFDFGMHSGQVSFDDSGRFLAFAAAIDHFMKTSGAEFADSTHGVVLYRGDLNFHERMIWSGDLKDYFEEWAPAMPGNSEQLFCVNLFAEYMHRLASYLAETFTPYCFFDTSSFSSKAVLAQLLSKERFGFIKVNEDVKADLGVVLPGDAQCDEKNLQALERIFADLEKQRKSYKIIPESLLSEEWEGLDILIALSNALSTPGKRMLQGFIASGGQVEYI